MHSKNCPFRLFDFTCTDQKSWRFIEEQNQSDAGKRSNGQHTLKNTPIWEEISDDTKENVIGCLKVFKNKYVRFERIVILFHLTILTYPSDQIH